MLEKNMRAIVYTQTGPASVLHETEREIPEPARGEVRIRVISSGVNPTDWKSRSGAYGGDPLDTDHVANQDGAGIIDAIGEGVDRFAVGDRVWVVMAAFENPAGGTAQEFTVVPAERAYPLPDDLSFELGASIGIPAMTAHRALTVAEDGPRRLAPGALEGRVVLVAGGAGAVGHAAIQLARWAGAAVITTVSSPEKAALATAAGAHHVINYREPGAEQRIREIAPDGVDQIVEVSAAANAQLNLAVIRERGSIAIYANNSGEQLVVDVNRNIVLNARYQYVLLYTMGQQAIDSAGEDITAALRDGALPIGEEAGLPIHHFPLERTADAHLAVEQEIVGKVLVNVAPVA
jgi:NADPH2:quinone reductase